MKVKIEEGYKKMYTLEEVRQAKDVIACMKEDESTAEEWAATAARAYTGDYIERVIEASAETCSNARVYNAYGDNTQFMDICIKALVKTFDTYLEITAYLTDIWAENKEQFYVVTFKR